MTGQQVNVNWSKVATALPDYRPATNTRHRPSAKTKRQQSDGTSAWSVELELFKGVRAIVSRSADVVRHCTSTENTYA